MKACKKKDIDDIALFHVTDKRNLGSIMKDGLSPDLSDFTREAYYKNTKNRLLDDGKKEPDYDEISDQLDAKYPNGVVFATEFENIGNVINMIANNRITGIGMKNIAVIGIKDRCVPLFRKEEIGSEVDLIAEESVSPDCLCFVDEKTWKAKLRQNA